MFDRLQEKATKAGPEEKSKITCLILGGVLGIEALSLALSALLSVGLANLFNNELVGMISIFAFIPAFTLLFLYLIDEKGPFGNFFEKKISKSLEEASGKKVHGYGRMPYFGKMFRFSQIMEYIKKEEFTPFINQHGKINNNLKISRDDKGVFICGGYLPIDLICGYNKEKNEIYAIDGTTIKLPLRVKLLKMGDDIEEFFAERGGYFTDMPENADEKFEAALKRPSYELSRADWGKVRYLWEKLIASNSKNRKNKASEKKFNPVTDSGALNKEIFERVLSDAELERTTGAVRGNRVALSRFMCFKDYKNEYSVCNGIRLLKSLKSPKNLDGIDFLFDCLNDVDEAYFHMAVDLLKTFPKELVAKELEKHAKLAYERYDVMKLGGLLYMAKAISYDIEYIKQLKESDAKKAKMVPGFDFDEESMFGDDEVQRFSLGAYMYQEK